MSSCGSTSPSTGRSFKLEKPGRGRTSASRCIFGWRSSSKLMIFDVGWWRKALVSVRSSKFQLTVKPIKVSVIPCQSFSCCNQLKLQFQWGPKNGSEGPACVLSADSWAHIQSITRGTPSLWICYLHIKAIYFPHGVFVLPRYLSILAWAHKCWKRKSQSVVGCFHFCWESSETWWAASFLAPCSRHTEQLPPHD